MPKMHISGTYASSGCSFFLVAVICRIASQRRIEAVLKSFRLGRDYVFDDLMSKNLTIVPFIVNVKI